MQQMEPLQSPWIIAAEVSFHETFLYCIYPWNIWQRMRKQMVFKASKYIENGALSSSLFQCTDSLWTFEL